MAIKLKYTVAVVQKEIRGCRAKYESVAKTEGQGSVTVEGRNVGRLFLPVYSKFAGSC